MDSTVGLVMYGAAFYFAPITTAAITIATVNLSGVIAKKLVSQITKNNHKSICYNSH